MPSFKKEYPPLLSPGEHNIRLEELEDFINQQYKEKSNRKYLVDRFMIFLASVISITPELYLEIWINGSFLTEKPYPKDMDIVIFYDPLEFNRLPSERKEQFEALLTDVRGIKSRFGCDVRFMTNEDNYQLYWKGLFGYSRNNEAKGWINIILTRCAN